MIKIITLIYNIYIDKITKKFELSNTITFLDTPLLLIELIKLIDKASKYKIK